MTLILVSESVPVNGFENFATMPCSELGVENPENNGLKLVLPLTLRNHWAIGGGQYPLQYKSGQSLEDQW
jgi:hypothetical protein